MIVYTVDNKKAYMKFKKKADNIIFENLSM